MQGALAQSGQGSEIINGLRAMNDGEEPTADSEDGFLLARLKAGVNLLKNG